MRDVDWEKKRKKISGIQLGVSLGGDHRIYMHGLLLAVLERRKEVFTLSIS
jgi:hypothetical protein